MRSLKQVKITIVLTFTMSLLILNMSCSSATESNTTVTVTSTQSPVTQTTTSTATVTQPITSTVTVTQTVVSTTTTTPSTTVPASTTTTPIPSTTTTTPSPTLTVSVPEDKTLFMFDKIGLTVFDQAAFYRNASEIQFFPFNDYGAFISIPIGVYSGINLYLDIQSDSPLDYSKNGIPFDSSGGQGVTAYISEVANGFYTSQVINFDPSWVYAYEQTHSGNQWETKILLENVDVGNYTLFFLNTSGKSCLISFSVFIWNQ